MAWQACNPWVRRTFASDSQPGLVSHTYTGIVSAPVAQYNGASGSTRSFMLGGRLPINQSRLETGRCTAFLHVSCVNVNVKPQPVSDHMACQDLRLRDCMVANIVSQLTLRPGLYPANGSAAVAPEPKSIYVCICCK